MSRLHLLLYPLQMQKLISIVVTLAFASPLIAGETAWQEIAEEANLRLISSDVRSADNKTMLALELTMPQATWTYWRVPGETGIPLLLDFEGSSGVTTHQIIWPFPLRELNYGYVDYVYHGDFVLPIELETQGETPFVSLRVIMGVCSDICVPVTATFNQQLNFEKRDSSNALRITQAMAETPIPWDQGPDPVRALTFDQENQQVLVQLSDPNIEISSMILATANPSIVFGSPQKSQIDGVIAFPKLGRTGDAELSEQVFTITFMSPSGPYELSHLPVSLSEFGE